MPKTDCTCLCTQSILCYNSKDIEYTLVFPMAIYYYPQREIILVRMYL